MAMHAGGLALLSMRLTVSTLHLHLFWSRSFRAGGKDSALHVFDHFLLLPFLQFGFGTWMEGKVETNYRRNPFSMCF